MHLLFGGHDSSEEKITTEQVKVTEQIAHEPTPVPYSPPMTQLEPPMEATVTNTVVESQVTEKRDSSSAED